MICRAPGSSCPCNFPGKNTGVRCHFLLQESFPTQGSNPCLLTSPTLTGRFFTTVPPVKLINMHKHVFIYTMYTEVFIIKCIVGNFTFNKLVPACTLSHLAHVLILVTLWTGAHLYSLLHGIIQAILEWVAVPVSRGYSQSRNQTHVSCVSCIAVGFFIPTWETSTN